MFGFLAPMKLLDSDPGSSVTYSCHANRALGLQSPFRFQLVLCSFQGPIVDDPIECKLAVDQTATFVLVQHELHPRHIDSQIGRQRRRIQIIRLIDDLRLAL